MNASSTQHCWERHLESLNAMVPYISQMRDLKKKDRGTSDCCSVAILVSTNCQCHFPQ